MGKKIIISFILLIVFINQNYSQQMPDTYSEGVSGRLNYGIYVPKNYDKTKKYPLVMFLHGWGNDYPVYLDWYNDEIQSKTPCFVFSPRTPTSWADWSSWNDNSLSEPMDSAIHVLDSLTKVYSIDINRLYVYGISMGGEGVFQLLYMLPNKFAAAMSVCGGGQAWWADKIKNTPFWMFHGGADNVNPPELTERVHNELVKVGAKKMRYTNYPGYGHDIWNLAASEPSWFDWMFSHSKTDIDCPKPDNAIQLTGTVKDELILTWNDVNDPQEKANKIWYYNIYKNDIVIGSVGFDKTTFSYPSDSKSAMYKVEAVNYCFEKSDFSNSVVLDLSIIKNKIGAEIKIYPNPSESLLHVESPLYAISQVTLFNSSGVIIKQYSTELTNTYDVNISDLSSGFYNIVITIPNHSVSKKVKFLHI